MTGAERKQKIESYGQAPELLEEALKQFPKEMWQFKPAADRWSIHEILVHLADAEVNGYIRARRFVAEPGQSVMAYDQDVWARKLNYHDQSADDALQIFCLLRKSTYNLLRALPDAAWTHTIQHPEYGTMTFDRWLELYERHTPNHIAQMQKNFDAWKVTQKK
jgi:uncharacterized damage-inducible protein DinB